MEKKTYTVSRAVRVRECVLTLVAAAIAWSWVADRLGNFIGSYVVEVIAACGGTAPEGVIFMTVGALGGFSIGFAASYAIGAFFDLLNDREEREFKKQLRDSEKP